jgi:hypothetical protein
MWMSSNDRAALAMALGQAREPLVLEPAEPIGGLVARPAKKKSIEKVVQGMRHRIAGVDAVADELVRRKDEVDGEQAGVLLEALRAVVAELEGAFEE